MRKLLVANEDEIANMERIRANFNASVYDLSLDIDISCTALRNFLMGFQVNPRTYYKCTNYMKGVK